MGFVGQLHHAAILGELLFVVLHAVAEMRLPDAEIVLRDDGGNGDLGYPWATMLSKNRALVVYYFNLGDGTRHIAGTVLEMSR